jgi:putative ABC transport system substrate-binding protein
MRKDRRRTFLLATGAFLAAPLAAVTANAQTALSRKAVAVFMPTPESDPQGKKQVSAFIDALSALGWVEGRNLKVVYRYASSDRDFPAIGAELMQARPDVIVVQSNLALRTLMGHRYTGAIVFASVSDPVGDGFVKNLAQPGGNITGFTNFEPATGGKWLQTLKDIAPGVKSVLVLADTRIPANVQLLRSVEAAATADATLHVLSAAGASDAERLLTSSIAVPGTGLIVLPSPTTTQARKSIIAWAAKNRVPTVYPFPHMAHEGGLVAYGIDHRETFRQAAGYVHRILNGARAGDLPVQQPNKYELVINAKAMRALGLATPASLIARADEVIE